MIQGGEMGMYLASKDKGTSRVGLSLKRVVDHG